VGLDKGVLRAKAVILGGLMGKGKDAVVKYGRVGSGGKRGNSLGCLDGK